MCEILSEVSDDRWVFRLVIFGPQTDSTTRQISGDGWASNQVIPALLTSKTLEAKLSFTLLIEYYFFSNIYLIYLVFTEYLVYIHRLHSTHGAHAMHGLHEEVLLMCTSLYVWCSWCIGEMSSQVPDGSRCQDEVGAVRNCVNYQHRHQRHLLSGEAAHRGAPWSLVLLVSIHCPYINLNRIKGQRL